MLENISALELVYT